MPQLPEGQIRCYKLQHLLEPASWLKTHTKHGWAEIEAFLLSAKPLVVGSCYENREAEQRVFIQVLPEGMKLLGCMVLSKTKVLLENMIIFIHHDDEIRLHVEDDEDNIQELYYYGEWKTRKRGGRRAASPNVKMTEARAAEEKKRMDADRVLIEIKARKEKLFELGLLESQTPTNETFSKEISHERVRTF